MKFTKFLFVSALLIGLHSCQKETGLLNDGSKPISDEVFNRFVSPTTLRVADSVTVQLLLNEFAPERKAFDDRFKADNPNLWEDYQNDIKAASQMADKTVLENHYKAMSQKYTTEMLRSFKNLNFDKNDITSRAKNILGDVSFVLGDFNEIIITATRGEDGIALPISREVRSSDNYTLSWYAHSHGLPHSEPPSVESGAYYSHVNALLLMKVTNSGICSQKSDIPSPFSRLIVTYPSARLNDHFNLFSTGGGAEGNISIYGTLDYYNGTQLSGTGIDTEIYRKQVIAIVGGIFNQPDFEIDTKPTLRSWITSNFPASTNKLQTGYKISISTESYGFATSSVFANVLPSQQVLLHYYN